MKNEPHNTSPSAVAGAISMSADETTARREITELSSERTERLGVHNPAEDRISWLPGEPVPAYASPLTTAFIIMKFTGVSVSVRRLYDWGLPIIQVEDRDLFEVKHALEHVGRMLNRAERRRSQKADLGDRAA